MKESSVEVHGLVTDLCCYHPLEEVEESASYETINEATAVYIEALAPVVTDPAELTTIIRAILSVKEAANRAYTFARIGSPQLIRNLVTALVKENSDA